MSYWKFKTYVNESGDNLFKIWREKTLSFADRDIVRAFIKDLAKTEKWPSNQVKQLVGHGNARIFELVIRGKNIQIRPLCCHGPKDREVTVLIGATKRKNSSTKFEPLDAIDKAKKRRLQILSDEGYVKDYE